MPRKIYSPKTKAAIVEAATAARKKGKTWAEAFAAAKEAGYTGSVQGITKMIGGGRRRRGRKPGRKPAATLMPRRGPGRPPKATAGLGSIDAMIGRLVADRVNAVLDEAIAALKATKK